ncbi:MAG: hypothetical protein KJ626_10670 [Verrucomicrobia bacterium]|nr:hypothetical protein [Verrucomicrobiota bacterium]
MNERYRSSRRRSRHKRRIGRRTLKKISLMLTVLGPVCLVSALAVLGIAVLEKRVTAQVKWLVVLEVIMGILLLAARGAISAYQRREQNMKHAAISKDMLVPPDDEDRTS